MSKKRNSSFAASTLNSHKKATHKGRKTEFSFSSRDDDTAGQNPNDLLYNALMSDPMKRAMVLQLLATQKDAILEYKKEQANMNRLKTKFTIESPTALLRRRALEQQEQSSSPSSSNKTSRQNTPSPVLPFDKILVGIKVFVDVMSRDEDRSAGVKALLLAMGADVKDTFSSDVTHVIFKDGSFETFQKATKLKKRLISVLWVEAVRSQGCRVPEADYPALGTENYGLDASVICEKLQNDYKEIIKDEMRKSTNVTQNLSLVKKASTIPRPKTELSQKLTDLCDRWRSSPTNSIRLTEGFSDDIIPATQDDEVASITSRFFVRSPGSDKLPPSDTDSDCGVIDGCSFNRSRSNLLEDNFEINSVRKSLFPDMDDNDAPKTDKKTDLVIMDQNKKISVKSTSSSEATDALITKRRTRTSKGVDSDGFKIPDGNGPPEALNNLVIMEENKRTSVESTTSCSEEIDAYVTKRRPRTKIRVDSDGFKMPDKRISIRSNDSSLRTSNDNATNISMKRKSSTSTEETVPSLRISSETERSSKKRSSLSTVDLSSLRLSESSEDISAVPITVTAQIHSEPHKKYEDKENNISSINTVDIENNGGIKVRRSCRVIRPPPSKEIDSGTKVPRKSKAPTKSQKNKPSSNQDIKENNDVQEKSDTILIESSNESSVQKIRRKRKLFNPNDIDDQYFDKLEVECAEIDKFKKTSISPVKDNFNVKKQIEFITSPDIDNEPGSSTVMTEPEPLHGFLLTDRAKLAVADYLEKLTLCNDDNFKTPKVGRRVKKDDCGLVPVNSSLFEQKDLLKEALERQNAAQKTPINNNNNDSIFETPVAVKTVNDSVIIEETPFVKVLNLKDNGDMLLTPKTSVLDNIVTSGVTTRRRTQRIISETTSSEHNESEVNVNTPTGRNITTNPKGILETPASKKIVTPARRKVTATPKSNKVVEASNSNKKITVTPRTNKNVTPKSNIVINETPVTTRKQITPKVPKSAIKTPANKDKFKTPKSVKIVADSPIRKSSRNVKDMELNDSLPIKPELNRRSTMEFMPKVENKTPKKIVTQKVKPRNATIVCSRFKSQESEVFLQIVKKLGVFTAEKEVTNRTTHLVVSENSRTINVLKAIARGIWVLKSEWLYLSLENEKWLPEEPFEMVEFSPAVQPCRIQRETFGPLYSMDVFQNCGPIYVARSSNPRTSDLEELIKLCKGKVATAARNASIVVGECLRYENITYVKEVWILDCITFNKCKTLKNYKLELPKSTEPSDKF